MRYRPRQHPADAVTDERSLYGERQHDRAPGGPDVVDRLGYEDDHCRERSPPPERPAVGDSGDDSDELLA